MTFSLSLGLRADLLTRSCSSWPVERHWTALSSLTAVVMGSADGENVAWSTTFDRTESPPHAVVVADGIAHNEYRPETRSPGFITRGFLPLRRLGFSRRPPRWTASSEAIPRSCEDHRQAHGAHRQ